jgi:hypothetical protein
MKELQFLQKLLSQFVLGRKYKTSNYFMSSSSISRPQFENKTYLKPDRFPNCYIAGIGYDAENNFVIQ